MALRARLVAPPPAPQEVWPWHKLKVGSVRAGALWDGDRRMEAEAYLSTGFGTRVAMQSKPGGWVRFEQLARVWMPGRLKGIQVGRDFGTPFLAATQVYDASPVPRKWLALARTADATSRFVSPGTILVTCSGSVGRPTLAQAVHDGVLISHDLLRVEPIAGRDRGWLYAYLHAPQVRVMTSSAQYGHIIKHLETSHLDALPIPTVDDAIAEAFERRVLRILELRDMAYRLTLEAEGRFEAAVGPIEISDWGELGFSMKASRTLFGGRRRLEASVHNPGVSAIRRHLARKGEGFLRIAEAGFDVWLPKRFRRVPAEDGVWLLDSADLTEVNPDLSKRIADDDFGDAYRGRVQAGWILMARSGQTYGIIGTAVLAGKDLEGYVVSDHVMRIKPGEDARVDVGYLVTAMSHPTLGRPLIKSLAYGSSIPEIDVSDIAEQEIVRLRPAEEAAIAELAHGSAHSRAEADLIEREIAIEADAIVSRFLAS